MDDPIRAYLLAYLNAQAVVVRMTELLTPAKTIMQALHEWRLAMPSVRSPAWTPRGGESVDFQGWPNRDQLNQALCDWHHALQAVDTAWNVIANGFEGSRFLPLLPAPETLLK